MRLRFRAPDLACQQMVELVTEYLEGSMTPRAAKRFEHHLAACDGCDAYLEQIRVTIAATGQVDPGEIDDEAIANLLDVYQSFLDESGHSDGPPGA